MRVVPLVERPDLVEQVSIWGFGEWGHLWPGQTLEQRTARMQARLNVDRLPVAFAALDDDDAIVGTASLIFDDLEGDPRNPWLASVFVPPERRGKGIASALVRAAEEAAQRLGYSRLYLFTTSSKGLYEALGWRALEQCIYRGEHIQVMDKDL